MSILAANLLVTKICFLKALTHWKPSSVPWWLLNDYFVARWASWVNELLSSSSSSAELWLRLHHRQINFWSRAPWLGEGTGATVPGAWLRGSAGYGSGDSVINRYCDDAVPLFTDLDG